MADNFLLWEQPGWQAEAHEWIRSILRKNDMRLTAEIEQPHIRPWSTVMTIPTDKGMFYFKASADIFAHETALTDFLAKFRPEIFPELIAVDLNRHWMLMRDAGLPIRQFIRAEKSIALWEKVLPLYADLQKDLTPHVDELLSLGMMDRRLSKLPALFESLIADKESMLLDTEDSLTTEEYARVKESVNEFSKMCERLASFGIPETIHHDDFHDANIFIRDEQIIFTDWGESAITHPFFTLVVIMRSVDNSMGVDFSPEAEQVRDMYLQNWTSYAPLDQLQSVLKLAQRIGYVNRALTWKMVIEQLPETMKPEYAIAVPSYLKDFINAES
ncbi:MAG: hypothetical protein HZB50_09905 [Chloroflexi bacterium]|nr:hypothetical protein [Chloroflexota bacterium]